VLHHAPRPRLALLEFANLARPGGRILVIDYARHEDEALRERQADVWMGFSEQELGDFAKQAGLVDVAVTALSPSLVRSGPDAHIGWLCLFASRPLTAARGSRKSSAAPARRDSNQKTETESTE
jgi:ArsR family transcriptional regulator